VDFYIYNGILSKQFVYQCSNTGESLRLIVIDYKYLYLPIMLFAYNSKSNIRNLRLPAVWTEVILIALVEFIFNNYMFCC